MAELLANTLGKPARDAVLRGEKSLVQEVALHALMKTFWPLLPLKRSLTPQVSLRSILLGIYREPSALSLAF